MMSVLRNLGRYLLCFMGYCVIFGAPLMASEGAAADAGGDKTVLKMFAAGLTIAIAAFGGAFGQAKAAAAALEAIGRNPSAQSKIFVPMIVALALIESLVIYALVVVFAKM
jgi:F-type H+-transporting ATPase subunit c